MREALKVWNFQSFLYCAKKRTRTSTGITPLAPQGSGEHCETPVSAHLEGIEEHPNASESTHSRVVPSEELRGNAIRILRLAALQEEIPRDEAMSFARGAFAMTEVGRLALIVLEGGPHAVRALVELSALVSHREDENVSEREETAG